MRDLNFFIKTIEKDLSDKLNGSKFNMKDFNSMPTTPTSILKKVEDQMRAIHGSGAPKPVLSNTCPNMAQILGTLENPPKEIPTKKETKKSASKQQPKERGVHEYKEQQKSNHTPSQVSEPSCISSSLASN